MMDFDPLEPGTKIGKFVVWQARGSNGYAEVYEAYDEATQAQVHVHLLSAAVAEDKTLFDRLNTELNSFVSHYHPNVGKMLTFENDPGTGRWYYVLECAEGDTLESRIAAKTLSPAEAIAMSSFLGTTSRSA